MYSWSDEVTARPGTSTAIQDVYKVIQARLDGYRQGAGAVMLGIVAGAFALDSTFIRSLLDAELLSKLASRSDFYFYWVVFGTGIFVECLCATGLAIIHNIGRYFAEMTSVIYKIDEANRMWEPGFWISGEPLYPKKFSIPLQTPEQRFRANVSRDKTVDPHLFGWHDPTIKRYQWFTAVLMLLHLFLYACLAMLGKAAT